MISYKENNKDNDNDNNTQYVDKDDDIIFQFGDIICCSFPKDFRTFLSPFQAFGIGISSLRNKKICE